MVIILRSWCAHIITLVSSPTAAPAVSTPISTLPLPLNGAGGGEEGDSKEGGTVESGSGGDGSEACVRAEGSSAEGVHDTVAEPPAAPAAEDEAAMEAQERRERVGEEREEVKRLLKALSALLQGFSTSKID